MSLDFKAAVSSEKAVSERLSSSTLRSVLVGWQGLESRSLIEGSKLLRTQAITAVWGHWSRACVRPSPMPCLLISQRRREFSPLKT